MDRGWSLIEDHVYYNLAHHSMYMGNMGDGINYLAKLLRDSRQSPKEQGEFLKDFYNVYRVFDYRTHKTGAAQLWRCRFHIKAFARRSSRVDAFRRFIIAKCF